MTDHFDSGRVEAFSDGVLAIAITLLVLEIHVPEDASDLWKAILEQWPSYLAYVSSFFTIGVVWLVHHGIFRRMAAADHRVVRLNLMLLMTTSFIPFPTGLLATSITDQDAERVAVLFYAGVLFVVLALLAALCRYVASREDLLISEAAAADLRAMATQAAPGLGAYLGLIAVAVVAPRVAAFGLLVVAGIAVGRVRGDPAQVDHPPG